MTPEDIEGAAADVFRQLPRMTIPIDHDHQASMSLAMGEIYPIYFKHVTLFVAVEKASATNFKMLFPLQTRLTSK